MTRMPSLLRPAWRFALAAVLAILALAAWSAPAQAGVSVTIQPPCDEPPCASPTTISTDSLTGDINQTYRVGSESVVVTGGVSVRQLLADTDTDFGYETIELARPDGSTLTMTRKQIADPRNQPVFYTDSQGTTYFIGPKDSRGVVAPSNRFAVGATVTLSQHSESELKVTISPSRKKIKPGGEITFRAKVTGYDPGETPTYKWWLEGKSQRFSGAGFTQKFPTKDGVYKFSVAVRIEGSAVSTTAVAKITVGDPKKADDEQNGNGNGDPTGPGSSAPSVDGGPGYTPSYTPSTPVTPAPPTPVPPSTPPPTSEPPKLPDIATSGTTVEGNLLADVNDPPPSNILESAARAAQEGKQKRDDQDGDGGGVSEAALSIGGVLALLALGAGIETRQGRRPRLRRPRRAA